MIVLLCPLARRATANNVLGSRSQQRRERQIRIADPVGIVVERDHLATRQRYALCSKNTIAANTSMAALTKNAIVRATVESMALKRMPRRIDRSSFPSLGV